ncbi:MAG: hypothetical protein ACPG8W_01945 [Candidatus Promineifilaceae bacterium]
MQNRLRDSSKIRQYVLTGAAIGIYFGWSFQPRQDPQVSTVIFLSVIITIVMTLIRVYQGHRENLLRRAISTFVQYALVISILQARHFALEWGGRAAVVLMTTTMGALSGYWLAYKEGG